MPIKWHGKTPIAGLPGHVRVRVVFEAAKNTDIRFSALYVQPVKKLTDN